MRLAHCSDLHLLSHDGARWLDLANKRWIGAMNLLSNRSRHYHVAAFEDMVEDLNAAGHRSRAVHRRRHEPRARAGVRVRARRSSTGSRSAPTHVTVIPGNHDAYVAEGVPLFAEMFAPYATTDRGWAWTEDDRDGAADDDLHWPIVRVRGELALIGVSTSRADAVVHRLRPDRRRPARAPAPASLVDARLRGKVRLVAIHHPPAGKRAQSRIRGLRDHAAFAEVIAETGADLIVHGHEHRDMIEALAGPGRARARARHRLGHLPPQQARADRALSRLRDRSREDRRAITSASGTRASRRFETVHADDTAAPGNLTA